MSRFLDEVRRAATTERGIVSGIGPQAKRFSWADIRDEGQRVAGALQASGLEPGDSVAVLGAEPWNVAAVIQGVWRSGASVTMLHQPTPRTDLDHWRADTLRVLGLLNARFVVLGCPFDEWAAGSFAQRGIHERTIVELLSGFSRHPRQVDVPEDAVALFQLTSGSTAAAKAVRISHRNLYVNAADAATTMELVPERDVIVSWLPLSHDMGMIGTMVIPMMTSTQLAIIPPIDFLRRPIIWAELIEAHRGTITAAPNFAYALLAKQLNRLEPGSLDLSNLRAAYNGAEPIELDTVTAFNEAAAAFGVRRECLTACYGSAENTMATSYGRSDVPMEVDVVDANELETKGKAVPVTNGGSADVRRWPLLGVPMAKNQVRIVDDKGAVVGERKVGAVQIKGEAVTSGYLTMDGFVPVQDADGWCDTGDLGYLAGGEIVICGRSKDVIIVAGRNIYPSDIERAAARLDGLRLGSVVAVRVGKEQGFPSESFVVLLESDRAGDRAAEAELGDSVAAAVVAEVGARPSAVRVVPRRTLPKTPSGKLRRTAALQLL